MNPAQWCNVVLALVLCGTVFTGCGSGETSTEKVAEKMIESASKIKGDEMDEVLQAYKATKKEPETEEAEAMEPVDLPEDFPGDVPLMSGFKATVAEAVGETPGSYSLIGTLAANPQAALAYYERELGARGWEETADGDAPETIARTFAKDGRTVVVAAVPGETGGSVLTLTHIGD